MDSDESVRLRTAEKEPKFRTDLELFVNSTVLGTEAALHVARR